MKEDRFAKQLWALPELAAVVLTDQPAANSGRAQDAQDTPHVFEIVTMP